MPTRRTATTPSLRRSLDTCALLIVAVGFFLTADVLADTDAEIGSTVDEINNRDRTQALRVTAAVSEIVSGESAQRVSLAVLTPSVSQKLTVGANSALLLGLTAGGDPFKSATLTA